MKLVWVGVNGYRRFRERNSLNVDGRVVAVVGPNEAGKTSLLSGLLHLNRSGDFKPAELSRGLKERPDGPILWARYLLEGEDLDAIAHLPGAKEARWFVVSKYAEGEVLGRVEPGTISRDLGPRRKARKLLVQAAKHKTVRELTPPEGSPPIAEALSDLASDLDSDSENLAISDRIRFIAKRVALEAPKDSPKYVGEIPQILENLAAHEDAPRPHQQAVELLFDRQPEFVLFGEEQRSLQSDYDLSAHADNPPTALRNLARLAKADLSEIRDAVVGEDFGLAEHLEEQANEHLEHAFAEAWRQSGVSPRFRLDGLLLRILVSAAPGGYTSFEERSEGLRWFIALVAYTTLYPTEVQPILLVDEAESHLHYDAQADLIRVFSQQRAVAKIIYTTHSAGCLPQDLGTGVRVVVPAEDGSSSVKNQFWSEGPGFSPLLTAMGASILAFTPSRYAVIAEGASEVILLPSLLREATDDEGLAFQVAPGLAELAPKAVRSLDLEAARVAYLVDGDKSGSEIKRKLKRGGVPTELIVSLGGSTSGYVLEDLLAKDLYSKAVNAEIERSHGSKVQITPAMLPSKNRPVGLKSWCEDQGISSPSKTAVAYRALEMQAGGASIIDPDRKTILIRAYDELREALGLLQSKDP
jgi:hypothetical protein